MSRVSRIRNALDGDVRSSVDFEEPLRDSYSFTRQKPQSSLTRSQNRVKSLQNRENEFQDRETGEVTLTNLNNPMT